MGVIFILIGCSLLMATAFLIAFIWASKSGQYEDDYTPSIRILFEDEPNHPINGETNGKSKRRK
ncbi:MAG: cbb3-type cytochrome oxidase assembly protein CcoS [Cyclobacteriaceae bacterium]